MKYTQEQLTQIFTDAIELFNETMDEEYKAGDDGIMLRFFSPENGVAVYEDFCGTYFPHFLQEDYKRPGRFAGISAEAFVSETHAGVMFRADLPFQKVELLQIALHEIAHIFCTRNEIEGGKFYQTYCDDPYHPIYGDQVDSQMNGYICAGYEVWREAIADIISIEAILDIWQPQNVNSEIKRYYQTMKYGNPDAKKAASRLIAYVALTQPENIEKQYPYFNKSTVNMLNGVLAKLKVQPFFEITPDFIAQLGSIYLMALVEKVNQR